MLSNLFKATQLASEEQKYEFRQEQIPTFFASNQVAPFTAFG